MHEIRATIPQALVPEAVRIANMAGISEPTTSEVFVHGIAEKRVLFSVETSTPKARAFTKALMQSQALRGTDFTLTSREVRAIISKESAESLTRPMSEPVPDIIQDLWQLSHITWSYLGRALAGAILLAGGIIEDNPIAIVVAALFLPFLSQVVAFGIGLWSRDKKLAGHGLKAVLVSITLGFMGGLIVALIEGGPIAFHGFKSPLSSFAISAVIGATAGLSNADDTGRRYLVGVAAAVQLAVFPVWFGAATIIGLPTRDIVVEHFFSFLVNFGTIAGTSVLAYALCHNRDATAEPD
jgi:hypothetical protein